MNNMDYKEVKKTVDSEGKVKELISFQQTYRQRSLYNNVSIMEDYWMYEKENGGSKITVLRHYLQSIADKNNVVKLPKMVRKVLLYDVGISENRFMALMNDLRSSQFIKGKNDFFMINPRISFKDSLLKREAFIKEKFWERGFFLSPKCETTCTTKRMANKLGYEFTVDSEYKKETE